jgi:hypothetical protein
MATVTPIYNWPVPTSTDYVKDGATAIESLGDAIDSSLNSITGGANVGLSHIVTTAFTSQSSVIFNNVFTSTYDSYRIVFRAKGSAGTALSSQLRASGTPQTSTYSYQLTANNTTAISSSYSASTNSYNLGAVRTANDSYGILDIQNPALARETGMTGFMFDPNGNFYSGFWGQYTASAFDGIAFTPASGTMTGQISIYGYRD